MTDDLYLKASQDLRRAAPSPLANELQILRRMNSELEIALLAVSNGSMSETGNKAWLLSVEELRKFTQQKLEALEFILGPEVAA